LNEKARLERPHRLIVRENHHAKHTVFFRFGTPGADEAASAVVCENLDLAVRAAQVGFASAHACPLYEITIRPGDHGCRLNGGKWVWPGPNGWPVTE
jgi:hypothetical protein